MVSGNPAPLPRPAPLKRWISWRDGQKPLLALALPDYQALERIADPRRVRTGWLRAMDRAQGLGLSFVGLPEGLWQEQGTLPFLSLEAAARGLGILLPMSLRALPREGNPRLKTLDQLVDTNPALIAGVDLSPLALAEDLDPLLEEEVPDLLRDRGIPYHCMSQDPLDTGGRLLRRAGFTAGLTGVIIPQSEILNVWRLFSECLSARLPDRPCSLTIATATPEDLELAASIGLVSGMGLIVLAPQSATGAMERAEDRVLAKMVSLLGNLPAAMEEPLPDPARSFLARRAKPGLLASDDSPVSETALPSLRFLRRLGFSRSSFLFEEQRREPPPAFLHVPAQGPLREDHWMRLHQLCAAGCQVLITGLCLDGEATRNRLKSLGLTPRALKPAQQPGYPHWMRLRPILDTGHQALSFPIGEGNLAFLYLLPERSQEDPTLIPGLLEHASRAVGYGTAPARLGEPIPEDVMTLDMPSLRFWYGVETGELKIQDL